MTPHLEEALLHELVDGEVPSTELGPIQAHLAACAECRGRLEEARTLAAGADRLIEVLDDPAPGTEPARPIIPRRRIPWAPSLAWAATLVLAAGLGYYVRGGMPVPAGDGSAPPVAAPRDATPAAASPAAGPPAPAAGPPAPAAATGSAKQEAAAPPREERKAAALAPERNEQAAALESHAVEPRATPPPLAPAPALAARDQALATGMARAAKQAEATAPDTISFIEAMRRVDGSLRVIEGLVPVRLEALGPDVRVIYEIEGQRLVLSQRLVQGRVEWRLTGPAGFPADSLARLRDRVRE